ncbi:permease [uncultured Algoriphagus sp.]|uniref:AEC family transporter n=1 Tax=uncultured Algoriphagus sp. TaxID=417365 RepID=UPI0030EB5E26|tara:strand:+ start:19443 stop:20579 length:1137 start_codon:yes stop_codon:yes gene_type:complete
MSIALQKTLSLLLLIVIGILLQKKLQNEDQKKGLKTIILNIALPAMIFVALLKIEINPDLLILPVLALIFNIVMIFVTKYTLPFFGIKNDTSAMRTLMLLLPSLAPGLTCFPFIVEYLGDDALALAALADIGNKVFVLILSYLLAMSWYYKNQSIKAKSNGKKIKELLLAMVSEPINLVMLVAIVLLSFGFNMESLPGFLSESVLMMKDMMTPLVLLFIGIAVIFKWDQLRKITSILTFRAGFTFLLSGLFIWLVPMPSEAAVLLAVVFPQSAVSFWPFAHMSAIRKLEYENEAQKDNPTFDLELGINVLAVSMPFSTLLILGVFTSGSYFTSPLHIITTGGILVGAALVPKAFQLIKSADFSFENLREKELKDSSAD